MPAEGSFFTCIQTSVSCGTILRTTQARKSPRTGSSRRRARMEEERRKQFPKTFQGLVIAVSRSCYFSAIAPSEGSIETIKPNRNAPCFSNHSISLAGGNSYSTPRLADHFWIDAGETGCGLCRTLEPDRPKAVKKGRNSPP